MLEVLKTQPFLYIQLKILKEKFPEIQGYEWKFCKKVPAGWLIENAGWKGKTNGNVASQIHARSHH